MEDTDKRSKEASLAAVATNYSLWNNHSVLTLGHSFPLQDKRKHDIANTKHIPSANYGRKDSLTAEKYPKGVDGGQLEATTWSVRDSSKNVSLEGVSKVDEHTKAKENHYLENVVERQLEETTWPVRDSSANLSFEGVSRVDEHTKAKEENSKESHYSENVDGWQLELTLWPVKDSTRKVSFQDVSSIDKHTKAREVISRINQLQVVQSSVERRGGEIAPPVTHQSFLNTGQFVNQGCRLQYGMTEEEYNFYYRREQLRMRDWLTPVSNTNIHPNLMPRLDERSKVKELGYSEYQPGIFQGVNPAYHNDHHFYLNTTQILPTLYGMTMEEYNLYVYREQLRRGEILLRNAYIDIAQRMNSRTNVQMFPELRNTRSCHILQSTTRHSLNAGPVHPEREGWQHGMREKQKTIESRRQSRMRTWSMRDSKARAESVFATRLNGHSNGHETKSREGQQRFSQLRDTGSHKNNIKSTNIQHSSNTGRFLSDAHGRQNRMTHEFKDDEQLGMEARGGPGPTSGHPESNLELRINEDSKIQNAESREGLRCRKKKVRTGSLEDSATKSVSTLEPTPQECPAVIDENQMSRLTRVLDSRKDFESNIQSKILESSEGQLIESNKFRRLGYRYRLTRIIEDHCSLLYTNGEAAIQSGSVQIISILLLIIVIMFGILLYVYSLNQRT